MKTENSSQTYFKKIIFILIGLILCLIFLFIVCEVLLRILDISHGRVRFIPDPKLHHVHPQNYSFKAYIPNGEFGGHIVHYNHEGLVVGDDRPLNTEKKQSCRIAFMGDSFTEAGQVEYSSSFVGLVEDSLEDICEVRNYGVGSYSPVIYLVQWREIVKYYEPTLVVLQLFSNDISSDEDFIEDAVFDQYGKILAVPGSNNNWVYLVTRDLYLVRFLRKAQLQLSWIINNWSENKDVVSGIVEEDPDISNTTSEVMLELINEIESSGARLLLMVVPSKYRLINGYFDNPEPQFSDKWKEWSKTNSVEFLDLVEPFEELTMNGQNLFFVIDLHFNEQGHAAVHDALMKEIPEHLEDN